MVKARMDNQKCHSTPPTNMLYLL